MSKTTRTITYRRKREGKTNYKKRLEMLKGRENRLIIRKTNKNIILQVVEYKPDGDHVIIGITSHKLETYGWKHSKKNIPAAYLAGILLAKTAASKGIKKAILDLGLQTPIKGSRLYAALKGVKEGGLDIPASDDVYPSEERLTGKHINEKLAAEVAATKQKILK